MPGDRSSSSSRKRDGRSGGSGGGRRDAGRNGPSGRGRGGDDRRGGSRRGRDEQFKNQPPLTAAERRSMDVKRKRGPKPPADLEAERAREREKIEARTTEQWVDEGSVRDAARAASMRARKVDGEGRRSPGDISALDPDIAAQLTEALGPQRGQRLSERLARASEALDRERFDEAKRIAASIAKEAPSIAAAHEIAGLSNYRLGRYKQAASSLELANDLHQNAEVLPVLADCYRALERWSSVDRIWLQIRESSPSHEVMAEGRIVAAGALADRGDLPAAIDLMLGGTKSTKKIRDHHLRQWYVLADLYDRLNDPIKARRWFLAIAEHDADYFDVQARLRHIGR